ncbi:hypothetical protein AAH978_21770 [Streptomyces sp. ZYX-F-203]
MKERLLDALKALVDEARPKLEGPGFALELFESSECVEKKSFGVYMERGGIGFYLTVWESGEVQVLTIDYDVNASPRERYLSDVHVGRLEEEFEKLVDWVSGSGSRS